MLSLRHKLRSVAEGVSNCAKKSLGAAGPCVNSYLTPNQSAVTAAKWKSTLTPTTATPIQAVKSRSQATLSVAAVSLPPPEEREIQVTSVSLDQDRRRLVLRHVEDGEEIVDEFPTVWLRDNCQCPLCYEKNSHSRIINLTEFDISVQPTSVKMEGNLVVTIWADGHVSEHKAGFLVTRSFREQRRKEFQSTIEPEMVLWGNEMTDNFPRVDYNKILESDEELFYWLDGIMRYGFVLVENVPQRVGCVAKLQERIAFQRLTHYGPGYDVEVKADPSNISYTKHRIFMHTDAPFYTDMPGCVFLHMIKQHQGKGGETTLADGFYAAKVLKEKKPEYYKLLSEVNLGFTDVGEDYIDFDKLVEHPAFVHDIKGNLKKVNHSHFCRSSTMSVDIDKVEDMYQAMKAYDLLLNDTSVHIKLKMRPGDLISLNNVRMMHGRTELEGAESDRHLACGYIDWDEVRSTWRVLRKSLNGAQ